MLVVLQRVEQASVSVNDKILGSINRGLLLLVAVAPDDSEQDIDWLINKILSLKIFPDYAGRMKQSVQDVSGELLIISQFTLYGDVRKGTVPSWSNAASPDLAKEMYDKFVASMQESCDLKVAQGEFQAHMMVELVNDGPVTLVIDSPVPAKK
ncbi:MAG: D-aminoacyl-tRNA deacylase [bacterium]|nr:D-aminoacyl-tRNA deacylase [bacterium]